MESLVEKIRQQKIIPKNSVIITFDDGYFDNYKFAYPVLKELQIPVTIYLATNYIGSSKYFWWDVLEELLLNYTDNNFKLFLPGLSVEKICQTDKDKVQIFWQIYSYLKTFDEKKRDEILNNIFDDLQMSQKELDLTTKQKLSWENVIEMSNNNISFGAHTETHSILSQVPLNAAKKEISHSKSKIESYSQKKVISFAYPVGGGKSFNNKVIEILKENAFQCAVTTIRGSVNLHDDLFTLRRYNIDGLDNFSAFKCKVFGTYELLDFIIKLVLEAESIFKRLIFSAKNYFMYRNVKIGMKNGNKID